MFRSRDDDARSRGCDAQTNIDFLCGLAIFLTAFLYVFTFIPGLFAPYQASAVDLSAVAYKTGAVLVEDPGWYIYTSGGVEMGNPAWETQGISRLARIGLAEDRSTPNVLSIDKVRALGNIGSYRVIREKIGLNGTLTYGFSLALVMNNTLAHRAETLLNIAPPIRGESVEYMERNVVVDVGQELFVDCGLDPLTSAVLQVDLSDRSTSDTRNVTFRVFNTSGPGTIDRVMWKTDPTDLPVPLVYRNQFIVRKNGVDVPSLPVAFNPSDTVEIVVYNKEIQDLDMNYLWAVSTGNVFPGGQIDYFNDPLYPLHSVCYPGVFKIEVWANDDN